MQHPDIFFRDLAYVFIAATVGGIVAWRLRQPLIIGYVLAGAAISPFTPGPKVQDVQTLELFAEIGVVLLMFTVGLEFSVRDLLRAKWVAIFGGSSGIVLSILLGMAGARLLGFNASQGFIIGSCICVASTMVMTRLLMDMRGLRSEPGLVMVSITLVEDLAVVVLIVVIPTIGSLESGHLLSIASRLPVAAIVLVPALFIAAKLVPRVLARATRTNSPELFFILVLAICLGTSAMTQAAGLSLALGAFVAGLIIGGSDFAREILAQVTPLRDGFVALFFVTIGLLINPETLFSNLPLLMTMLILIIVGKFFIWLLVITLFRYPLRTALVAAVGLTQIGEFSFIVAKTARESGLVGNDVFNATLAASLVTILTNAALLRWVSARFKILQERPK